MRGAAVVEPRDCPVLGPRPTLSLRGCCGCVAPMGQPGFLTGWEPPPSLQAPTSELRPPVKTDSKHPARPPRPVPALFSPRIPGLPSNTSVSRRPQSCPRLHPPHSCHRNALHWQRQPCHTVPWHPAPLRQGKLRQTEPSSPPSPGRRLGAASCPQAPCPGSSVPCGQEAGWERRRRRASPRFVLPQPRAHTAGT